MKKTHKFTFLGSFDAQKSEENSNGVTIAGYASTVSKDRHGDVIVPEAWSGDALVNYRKNPILLAYHDRTRPIGKVNALEVDEKGLKISAEVSKAAGDVYDLVQDGVLKALSVSIMIKDADYDSSTDIFIIKQVELLEISVVSIPANQDSLFDLSKSFSSDAECLEFKKSFDKRKKMDKEELATLMAEVAAKAAEKAASKATEDLQAAELAKKEAEAAATAKAAAEEAQKKLLVETVEVGVEKMAKDLAAKYEAGEAEFKKALDEVREELKAKTDELAAMHKTKGLYNQKSDDGISYAEKELAVLEAVSFKIPIEKTVAYARVVEKAGPHAASAKWEDTVSTQMLSDIRANLVIAPLFRTVEMTGPNMALPLNPESSTATWVHSTGYIANTSSGSAVTHQLAEVTLSAYKLATKELLGNEEDKDSIIALMPIIRDAAVRRMSRSVDKGMLLGTNTTIQTGFDPFKGLTTYNTGQDNTLDISDGDKLTVLGLAAIRTKLGMWGLNPNDITYVVSPECYLNLLEDTNFLTMDKVGDRATLLTGQVGMVLGSPVVVSAEFEAKADTKYCALVVARQNFITGNYLGLRLESEYRVESQATLLVASMRQAFKQVSTTNGHGVVCIKWVA